MYASAGTGVWLHNLLTPYTNPHLNNPNTGLICSWAGEFILTHFYSKICGIGSGQHPLNVGADSDSGVNPGNLKTDFLTSQYKAFFNFFVSFFKRNIPTSMKKKSGIFIPWSTINWCNLVQIGINKLLFLMTNIASKSFYYHSCFFSLGQHSGAVHGYHFAFQQEGPVFKAWSFLVSSLPSVCTGFLQDSHHQKMCVLSLFVPLKKALGCRPEVGACTIATHCSKKLALVKRRGQNSTQTCGIN